MDARTFATPSDINGDVAALATERALTELRRGRAIVIRGPAGNALVAPVETLGPALLERMRRLAGDRLALVVTVSRARALGVGEAQAGAHAFRIGPKTDLAGLRDLAGMTGNPARIAGLAPAPWTEAMAAAIALAKRAQLLPAVLAIEPIEDTGNGEIVAVGVADIGRSHREAPSRLEAVSRAHVPMETAERCELVVFREPAAGADHLAIVIGAPDTAAPVPVRLHSSCLTGDLLGSLRCDCGSQLHRAIAAIAAAGGGVLLYLAQEGRGIGLANKLRAYALQDRGFDTIDADEQLGFDADERGYGAATAMLRALDIGRVVLLTNNPDKVAALEAAGIEVVARQPLRGGETAHNRRYLEAKRDRAGHLFADDDQA